ncbi:ribonuclease P protein component [Kangiella shandongensis]|uniref:ribonuclease P protein component n=1 Tax=Kangiella shandongensis TaxID=2763258 RepID=UPI001CBBE9A7|nr:ribonuclease P protein component [Kangiella shandongensis]
MSNTSTERESDSLSFPRDSRLLTAEDYKNVFSKPLKLVCPPFTLLVTPNSLNHPRIGLIVAKKHVKYAVERNRLKRICRQSFRLMQHNLPHYDMVLLARRGSSDMSNAVLFEHLNRLWSRAKKKCSGC